MRFRQRLVDTVDRVLDLLESGRLPVFLLDGQAVLIRDYLDVRPEQRERVQRLAAAGKLLLGPWWVLADELLSSDETLVRNLLAGKREAGRGWLALGYSPDAFGHPAGLPTILAGFGIEYAILWRGYGGEAGEEQDLFHWKSADGSRVLVHHLPAAGHELGANLPTDRAEAARRWEQIRATLEPRAKGRPLLLLNGADHHAPQADLLNAAVALQRTTENGIRIASPLDYFAALPTDMSVPGVTGELRFSYRHCWTLQGTHAVRARVKALIREGERLLLRWAEPQAALAHAGGAASRQAVLDAAWREHLLNTFHDTLCGTTTDEVAREAATRARNVIVQARAICDDALHDRLGQDRSRARRNEGRWTPTLAVVNPSAYDRSGVVEATLLVATERIRVGAPGLSSFSAQRTTDNGQRTTRYGPPPVLDAAGNLVRLQTLDSYDAYHRLDAPDAYPLQDKVRAWRVALWAEDVPALGVRTYRVEDRAGGRGRPHSAIGGRSGSGFEPVRAPSGAIESHHWRVHAGRRGFRLEAVAEGISLDEVGHIVSERDDGDLYTFEPVFPEVPVHARWRKGKVVWRGPLIGALARPFEIPGRARGVVYARLDAGSNLVRFVVEGENLNGGHRLRIRFPLPASRSASGKHPSHASRLTSHVADQHYGPVYRERHEHDVRDFPKEWPVQTAPMQRYVTVPGGLTVLSRDCYEYELTADGAIVVTVLRSVRELSKGDLAARPGHAAWPTATPDAQELGAFRAELAVTLETAAIDQRATPGRQWAAPGRPRPPVAAWGRGWGRVEAAAEEFHAPLSGRMLRYAIDAPEVVKGPRLEGAGLGFKSCKLRAGERKSESAAGAAGATLVLRCVNLEADPATGTWVLPFDVRRAWKARLDEAPVDELRVGEGGRQVAFEAGPREVVTIVVEVSSRGVGERP